MCKVTKTKLNAQKPKLKKKEENLHTRNQNMQLKALNTTNLNKRTVTTNC